MIRFNFEHRIMTWRCSRRITCFLKSWIFDIFTNRKGFYFLFIPFKIGYNVFGSVQFGFLRSQNYFKTEKKQMRFETKSNRKQIVFQQQWNMNIKFLVRSGVGSMYNSIHCIRTEQWHGSLWLPCTGIFVCASTSSDT